MRTVILGTGSTAGTFGAAAGVVGFVRRLAQVRPDWRAKYPWLARVIDDCEGAPEDVALDQLWTRLDYYAKFRKVLGACYPGDASTELHRAILDAYGFAEEIDRIRNTPRQCH